MCGQTPVNELFLEIILQQRNNFWLMRIFMCVFGTSDSNSNSVILIQNHWVPHQKKTFGTCDLSEN